MRLRRRYFIVVDMARDNRGRLYGQDDCFPWRVIGDGLTVKAALRCAVQYEQEDPCPHCERAPHDRTWRVYPIEGAAWDMLTCGGPYADALKRGDFSWCEARGMFIEVEDATCIACRGEGTPLIKRDVAAPAHAIARKSWDREPCPACKGQCRFPAEGQTWCKPPKEACVWRGDRVE